MDKRRYVRIPVEFEVKFRITSEDEYKKLKNKKQEILYLTNSYTFTFTSEEEFSNIALKSIIRLLIHLDNKIDNIYELLTTGNKNSKDIFYKGIGMDISGTGLRMVTGENLPMNTLIFANFILSKFPFIYIELLGKVVRCEPIKKGEYSIAINFVDISHEDREKIIEYIFQKQRHTLRKKRAKEVF